MNLTLEDVLNKGIEQIKIDITKSITIKVCEGIIETLSLYKSVLLLCQ